MTVTFLTLTAADKDASVREERLLTADLLQPSRGRKPMKELLRRKDSRSGWAWFRAKIEPVQRLRTIGPPGSAVGKASITRTRDINVKKFT